MVSYRVITVLIKIHEEIRLHVCYLDSKRFTCIMRFYKLFEVVLCINKHTDLESKLEI